MSAKLRIYLAGAMKHCESFEEMNGWRVLVKKALLNEATANGFYAIGKNDLQIINPCDFYNFEIPRHQNELEVMKYDIAKVKSSDMIIVNLDGLDTSIGTAIEMYVAYTNEIPVIAYDPNWVYESIHSWLKCCITRVEPVLDDLIEYVRDFYFALY